MSDAVRPGLVSVITPCYNAERFIGETIASVEAQTYQPIEHIVVDDASRDGSWTLVQSKGSRVRAFRQPRNAGAAAARNVGFACSSGEYLMFLDADDVIGPDVLRVLVGVLRDRSDTIAACSWQRLVHSGDTWRPASAETSLPEPGADPLLGWLNGIWVPPCAVLWRRDVYERVGGWDETLTVNDDGDLMMRALARGVALVVAENGGALYRAHGTEHLSLSRNVFAERHLRSQLRVLVKLIDELQSMDRLSPYRDRIGVLLLELALTCHQGGFVELARECSMRSEAMVGRRVASRTRLGRLLTRLLGVERKERLAHALARFGVLTAARKQRLALERKHADRS